MSDFIEKHLPREYTSFIHDGGVVLCDKETGAFLCLRYQSDLERLKELLNKITIIEVEL